MRVYNIISISVNDLHRIGFAGLNVSESTMSIIAEEMATKYLEKDFWSDLEQVAIKHEIPRRTSPDDSIVKKGLGNRLLLMTLGYESSDFDRVNWESVYSLAREKNYKYYEGLNVWFDMNTIEPFELEILTKLSNPTNEDTNSAH